MMKLQKVTNQKTSQVTIVPGHSRS